MFCKMFSYYYKPVFRIKSSYVFRNYCKKVTKTLFTEDKISLKHFQTYGQPTFETHPHLLKENELTPYLSKQEFQDRRQKLIESIRLYASKLHPELKNHVIVIPSATKQYMSGKIPYFFRQNTDFLYLSGCQEPDSCLILSTKDLSSENCITLFLREKDRHSEVWDGPRTGPENAVNLFGVDQSLSINEFPNYLKSLLNSNKDTSVWYDYTECLQESIHTVMNDVVSQKLFKLWESPTTFIQHQRLIKSPAEIALMQKSCDIASNAIVKTIEMSKPKIDEHQIFSKVDYECRMNGAEFLAYPPVVAGGERANIIHYINNNQIVEDGDMVLMDAGCEYHGYSSDITRTWPINGKFNSYQKDLYEIVLEVQLKLIELCKNYPTLDSLFDSMCLLLGEKLQNIGIIPKNISKHVLMKTAYHYCPHHVSHYLGMDVHDTPLIKRSIEMVPGMILTIEPGIYIDRHQHVPEGYKGLGIRIEDDVLITENGPVVLSRNCPKTVEEIEKIASKNQR